MCYARDISSMRYALWGIKDLYHIATEQSEVISRLNEVKIYRTSKASISPKE